MERKERKELENEQEMQTWAKKRKGEERYKEARGEKRLAPKMDEIHLFSPSLPICVVTEAT